MSTTLPENNTKINIKLFLLDPLSVIIKLAILGNKPVGTKILIQNNILYLQEPGPFQSLCRFFFNSNKTDLQYMYNPIQIACDTFLTLDNTKKNQRIKNLFVCAQNGIKKLIETYRNCSIISLCLNYYYIIISNYVEGKYNETIFLKDTMTCLYPKDLVEKLNKEWTDDKIKIILDLITFLKQDNMANANVKSLENIINNIDKTTQAIFDEL